MTIVLPALAVAFAAFCVWLAVRIVNRKERWAKWTLSAALSLPVLYVLSFGPASRLLRWDSPIARIYEPCIALTFDGPKYIRDPMWWWVNKCGGIPVAFIYDREAREMPIPDPEAVEQLRIIFEENDDDMSR